MSWGQKAGKEDETKSIFLCIIVSIFCCCCYGSEYEVQTRAGVSKKLCQLNILLNTYNLSSTALDT